MACPTASTTESTLIRAPSQRRTSLVSTATRSLQVHTREQERREHNQLRTHRSAYQRRKRSVLQTLGLLYANLCYGLKNNELFDCVNAVTGSVVRHRCVNCFFLRFSSLLKDTGAICLASCVTESCSGPTDQARNCLQWQMNLLTHIEDVQNQVAGRMDLIEKELDGETMSTERGGQKHRGHRL